MEELPIHTEPGPAGIHVRARRNPVQSRSQETVKRILQAASQLLADKSIEEVTTSSIARRAGVSVGALYRFFPNKQAIIDALAVHHVGEFRRLFESRLREISFDDGPAFLGAVVDAFVAFLEERPDFRAIAFGRVSPATRTRQTHPDAVGAGFVKRFMIETLGMDDASLLDLRLRIAIETGERLFAYAFEQDDSAERTRIINETKQILSLYLFAPETPAVSSTK